MCLKCVKCVSLFCEFAAGFTAEHGKAEQNEIPPKTMSDMLAAMFYEGCPTCLSEISLLLND